MNFPVPAPAPTKATRRARTGKAMRKQAEKWPEGPDEGNNPAGLGSLTRPSATLSRWERALVLTMALFSVSSLSAALLQTTPQAPNQAANEETAFLCPMHPDYTLDVEGKCPRCGMALVKAAAYDVRDYRLDFRTIPAVVTAGRKATLLFKISHPSFNAVIQKFEVVHDRQYHLFVISQDMEYFQHIHPEERADGTWTIDLTLPKPGYYKVLSDFLPAGGSTQFIARPLVTAGYAGDLAADSAHLVLSLIHI